MQYIQMLRKPRHYHKIHTYKWHEWAMEGYWTVYMCTSVPGCILFNMLKIMRNYQAHKMPVDDNLHMTPLLHPPPTPTPPPPHPPLGLNPSTNISYKTTSTCWLVRNNAARCQFMNLTQALKTIETEQSQITMEINKQERYIAKSYSKACKMWNRSRNHGINTRYIRTKNNGEPWRGIHLYIALYLNRILSTCLR